MNKLTNNGNNQPIKKIKSKNIILNEDSQKRIINFLTELLKPSIDDTIFHKIEEIVFELLKNPTKLDDESTINKLLNITNERVDLDRGVFSEKSQDLKKIITLLVREYEKSLITSDNSKEKLNNIKDDLNGLELSTHSVREVNLLRNKLTDIVYDLENSIDNSKLEILKSKNECNKLQNHIKKLQNEIDKIQKEKDIDFLTGVLNRRGYTGHILKVENRYSSINTNYAIIFMDIDDFKDINDTYGHDCGDTVIKTFSIIVKQMLREEDTICRYGGEEFVVLLNYADKNEVINYVKRVKKIITEHRFVYTQDIKIKVSFSAGVSFRSNYSSYDDAVKYADILLYKAKHEGKKQIIFDDETVI